MRLAIMQPYFFPYLGYFQLIHAVDRFFLYDNLDYSIGGWVNRNRILVVRTGPTFLSVPIKDRKGTRTIREVELLDGARWRKKLLRSIHVNYRRAPCFGDVSGLLEEILYLETSSLSELNKHGVARICDYLGIETELVTDSTPFDDLEVRLRGAAGDLGQSFPRVLLQSPPRKLVRALEICHALGAELLVNAIGGRALYRREDFATHGVELYFVQTRPHCYRQRSSAFHPSLSIIDVLMNCDRDQVRRLLTAYDLV